MLDTQGGYSSISRYCGCAPQKTLFKPKAHLKEPLLLKKNLNTKTSPKETVVKTVRDAHSHTKIEGVLPPRGQTWEVTEWDLHALSHCIHVVAYRANFASRVSNHLAAQGPMRNVQWVHMSQMWPQHIRKEQPPKCTLGPKDREFHIGFVWRVPQPGSKGILSSDDTVYGLQ